MALPLGDLKDVFTSGSDAMKSREEPVRVAIFVDKNAPESLIQLIRENFMPQLASGMIHVGGFQHAHEVTLHTGTDLAVIVAGSSAESAKLLEHCRRQQITAVIVAVEGEMLKKTSAAAGVMIPTESLISEGGPQRTLDKLAAFILHHMGDKSLAFAVNFPFVRKTLAEKVVADTAKQNAVVGGVVIIPGADMPVMTANQAKMILQIAAAYNQDIGPERIKELAVAVGGGFALRTVARQAVTAFPGLGWAIKAGIGYSGTLAMGKAVIQYFEEGGHLTGIAAKLKEAAAEGAEKIKGAEDKPGLPYKIGNALGALGAKLSHTKDDVADKVVHRPSRSERKAARQEQRNEERKLKKALKEDAAKQSLIPNVGDVELDDEDVAPEQDTPIVIEPPLFDPHVTEE